MKCLPCSAETAVTEENLLTALYAATVQLGTGWTRFLNSINNITITIKVVREQN